MRDIISLGVNALKHAYVAQRKLFENGTIADLVEVGRGDDKATRGDWESEEAVIRYLQEEQFPLKIFAEEHGNMIAGSAEHTRHLAILDGIDGSSQLVKNPASRCGTMLTIADSLTPCYDDFIFAGITEYFTNRIVYGIKGEGVFEIQFPSQQKRQLLPFLQQPFSSECIIKVDCYTSDYAPGITAGMGDFKKFMGEQVVGKLQGKAKLEGAVSSAAMCLDLLTEKADAVFQIVAKGVFEPPAMYMLTTELGGTATDLAGNDLTYKKWGPVGMNINGALFASSPGIAEELARMINYR
ncbi:MAG: Inositol monophosphatase family [archaeon]